MKTKLRFLFVLLTMLWWGANFAWGDTYSIVASNYSSTDDLASAMRNGFTNGSLTVSFSNVDDHFQGNNNEAGEGIMTIKMRGSNQRNAQISVNTSSSNITIQKVVITYAKNKRTLNSPNSTLTTDDTNKTYTFEYPSETSITISNTDANLLITQIDITYTDSRSSLNPAFDWNEMEIHNAGGDQHTYVCSSTFVYESSKDRMKVRLTVTPKYEGIYGTISSTDETVLNTSQSNVTGVNATTVDNQDAWEVIIDNIKVLKTGSATLRFWFNGNESYKPTTLEIPITVIAHSITPFNNSYRYTWDFAGGDWASTIAQLGYGNGDDGYNWTKTIVEGTTSEARPTYHDWIPSWSGIDMIAGLEFHMEDKNDLCLDWFTGRKGIWMNTNATVTIPNLVKDQKITIAADRNDYTITGGSAEKEENVITVTAAGSVTLKMAQATRISSIAVSNSQYGWSYTTTTTTLDKERPTSGTFTFTEPGPITGGKEIDEVPGITLTVGASGDSWDVVEGNGDVNPDFKKTENNQTWNIGYVAVCKTAPNTRPGATSGCFYTFEAIVNGELTIHYYTRSGAYVYNGSNPVTSNSNSRIQDITFKVEAGKTYTLEASTGTAQNPSEGIIWLNSFTFTPMFFHPGTTTNQRDYSPAVFPANMNTDKSAFPKLINPSSTDQQNKVKFAGDREKVYLYKNNDVEIIGAGTNILIRGTVLDKNNEDGLVAYYYLNSYVLTVTSYELEDQAYISTSGLMDGKYQFTFSGNIQAAVGGGSTVTVQVKKDAGTIENVTATISGNILYVPFASLAEGTTYKIIIPQNTVALSSDANTKNVAIECTFSVNGTNEGAAQVKMIYPTGLATVGTSIILETYLNGSASFASDAHKVKGILSDGETDMVIDAIFSGSQLAFKPTATLSPNTTYTLTIPTTYKSKDNKIYLSTKYTTNPEVYYQVTHDKVFTFTTGSSSGTAPLVIANGTYPAEGAVVSSGEYSGGTISFTFDQTVELEPYSTVSATPINGSESTAHGSTGAPNAENNTLTVSADGKTVSFDFPADGLKYDLYYQVVIPANTVIGVGGLPNSSPITLNFKMGSKPTSSWKTGGTAFTGYPYTWNFTNFGTLTSTIRDIHGITDTNPSSNNTKGKNSRWQRDNDNIESSSFKNYWTNGMEYPQGEVATYNLGTTEKENDVEIAEMRGLRWSLATRNSSGANGRMNINHIRDAIYNLQMAGGTHYLTIPNVPAGKKVYIKATVNPNNTASRFNINSNNATFNKGYASADDKTIGVRGVNGQVYEIDVVSNGLEQNDVTFCLQDVTFEMIAVATEEKAISSVGYATNARSFPVDYTLDGTLLGTGVTAYKITGVSGNRVVKQTVSRVPATTETNQNNGVMLQGGERSWPLFTLDINSSTDNFEGNLLKGVVIGSKKLYQKTGDYYNYILSNGGYVVKYDPDNAATGETVGKADGLGFYLVLEEGSKVNGVAYEAEYPNNYTAYLQIGSELAEYADVTGVSSTRRFFSIDFDDEPSGTNINRSYLNRADDNSAWYTLQGVRIANPGKGFYIHNGKKIVIK